MASEIPVHLFRTITGEPDTPYSVSHSEGEERVLSSSMDTITNGFETVILPIFDEDEDDVFQCGRCKIQVSSLLAFIEHKNNECTILSKSREINAENKLIVNSTLIAQSAPIRSSDCPVILQEFNATNTAGTFSLLPKIQNHSPRTLQEASRIQQPTQTEVLSEYLNLRIPIEQHGFFPQSLGSSTISPEGTGLSEAGLYDGDKTGVYIVSDELVQTQKLELPMDFRNEFPKIVQCGQQQISLIQDFQSVSDLKLLTRPAELDQGADIVGKRSSTLLKTENKASTSTSPGQQSLQETVKKNRKCDQCGKTFKKLFNLRQHIRSHTGEKPFNCFLCGRGFTQKSNVKKHMATHKIWPKIKSTMPKELVTLQLDDRDIASDELQSHKKKNELHCTVSSVYFCQYCDATYPSHHKLKTHMKTHTAEKVFKCNHKECVALFSKMDDLINHIKSDHENDIEYSCFECDKPFHNFQDLEVHRKSHFCEGNISNKRKFTCVKCNNRYASKEALQQHILTSSHKHTCVLCHLDFVCERYLRRHFKIHRTLEPFKCEQCGKLFKRENYLKSHLIIHSNEKPFKCDTCGALFNRRDKLSRHKLIHEKRKKFKCTFKNSNCTREFYRKDKLKEHMDSHSRKLDLCETENSTT